MSAVSVQNLSKSFRFNFIKKKTFIQDLSLSVSEGEIYCLVGPNGSGKTTLLKTIVGLLNKDAGDIHLLKSKSLSIDVKKKMGYLPDTPVFPPHMSAISFLNLVAELYQLEGEPIESEIVNVLKLVGLYSKRELEIKKYSKGMLKRLGFAQILLPNPELLVFDEPMDGLDPLGLEMFRGVIQKCREEGKTVLLTSHLLNEVEQFCDRVGFIKEGKIVFEESIAKNAKKGSLEKEYLKRMGEENE